MVCILTPNKTTVENIDESVEETEEIRKENNPTMDDNVGCEDGLLLRRIAGGNLIKYPPVFSPTGESVFVIDKNVVHVYSTATGEWTRDFERSSDDNVSLEYSLSNPKILVACSKSAEITQWKCRTGAIESKVKLPLRNIEIKTFHLLDMHSQTNASCALITFTVGGHPKLDWSIIDTTTGQRFNGPVQLQLTANNVHVAVENQLFHYFAITQDNVLYVVNYKSWRRRRWFNAQQVPFTCVVSHPTEELLATGDERGRIFIWRDLYKDGEPYTSLYHWHHTPVTSVAFSSSGSGFYSSGQEAVLVIWNMDRPDLKSFYPRMSSVIVQVAVAPENSAVACATADNGIQILGNDHKPKSMLQNFTHVFDDKTGLEKFPIGLCLHPRTNCVVSNGRTGHLQFFSTYTKSLLYNVDIVIQNRLSIETGKILYDIRVTHADFNIDWMATGEIYDDQEHLPELRLKFWEFQKESQTYTLNTSVELPHEGGFKAIRFSNQFSTENLLCATAGQDNIIKIWSLEDSDSIYKTGKVWTTIAQTRYKNFPLESVSFSQDGSLLSAGYGNTLCVYKAETLKLKAVLSVPTHDGSLQKAQIQLPKENLNGSKSELNENRKKILKLFTSLLEGNDESLVQEIKRNVSAKKPKKIQKLSPAVLNDKQREQLFKKVHSLTELSLFQKVAIFQRLGVYCKVPKIAQNKIVNYLHHNIRSAQSGEAWLERKIYKIGARDRFKAKFRLNKFARQRIGYDQSVVNNEIVPFVNLLSLNGNTPRKQSIKANGTAKQNGLSGVHEDLDQSGVVPPPVHVLADVRHVVFATGEFAHLVVVCTSHRVLIWNLLTLRLQCSLKLSVEHIVVDPLTNLFAAFTQNRELYVFLPNAPMPIYHRRSLPRIVGACWVPRRYPKSQSINIDWQSNSILYFLTEDQEIMFLASEDETNISEPNAPAYLNEPAENVRYTAFGTLAASQTSGKLSHVTSVAAMTIGVPGKSAVKTLIDMATHTMPPLNLLCNQFMKSLVTVQSAKSSAEEQSAHANSTPTTTLNNDKDSDDDGDDESSTEFRAKNKLRKTLADKSKQMEVDYRNVSASLKEEERLRKICSEAIHIDF